MKLGKLFPCQTAFEEADADQMLMLNTVKSIQMTVGMVHLALVLAVELIDNWAVLVAHLVER